MRWQRARLLRAPILSECKTTPPAGFCCWVEVGRPRQFRNGRGYLTNIIAPPEWRNMPPLVACIPEIVELLPEFCEDPPRIAWGAWEREDRATR